jgi:hypothetical protein
MFEKILISVSIGTRAGINPPLVNKARTLHIFSDTGKTKMMFCHG